MDFYNFSQTQRRITDGAMGTYYSTLYGVNAGAPELANETDPFRIQRIHQEYIRAGADIIRTNTFASNKETLCSHLADTPERSRILDRIYRNVSAACRIAKAAAEAEYSKNQADLPLNGSKEIYIAGDIGPIPESGRADENEDDILEEYRTMAKAFLDCGIRVIWFETFSDFQRILPVARWIRSVSDAFVMASFSVNPFGFTKSGVSMKNLIKTAEASSVIDGIGFNCGVGPTHLRKLLQQQNFGNLIVSAAPNSGYADKFQNRSIYQENTDYFNLAMKEISALGVNILGGCCGTTPAHIRKLAGSLGGAPVAMRPVFSSTSAAENAVNYQNNLFWRQLSSGQKVIIAEIDPPHNGDSAKMEESAAILKEAGVHMITFSDSPMGKMRADSISSAIKIGSRLQVDTMPHLSCRDRNVIGLGASILGAYMNGLRHFLIVTGDPVPSDSRDIITSVYDFNSIKFMQYIKQMNEEHFSEDPIVYGGALNYGRKNIDVEIRRVKQKCEAGAAFFLTQPVYSDEDIERIRRIKEETGAKIICGILPLVSYRNAVFMQNEVAGIRVPDEIVRQYDPDMDRSQAQQVGVDIAVQIARKLSSVSDGLYFMIPFNRAAMLAEILRKLRGEDS